MSGGHRRPPRVAPVTIAAAICAGAFGALVGATVGEPAPQSEPSTAPTSTVVEPVRIPAVHEMTVFDDDQASGQQRCEAWSSLYPLGAATCSVRPIGDAPDRRRADDGAEWWNQRHGDDLNEK